MKKKKIKNIPICATCRSDLYFTVRNIYNSKNNIIDLYSCGVCGDQFEVATIDNERIVIKKVIKEPPKKK